MGLAKKNNAKIILRQQFDEANILRGIILFNLIICLRYSFKYINIFLQYFLFLNMGEKANYKRFAPYMYIVAIAVALWTSIFYSVGYSFYKILAVFIIGIPITPLVWQFMSVYKEKNARDKQLSQWEEVK